MLLDDYRARVDQLFAEVRETQTENIIAAGKLVADAVAAGCNIYLSNICHYMEYDLLERGGGPTFYKPFRYALELKNYTTHYQARRRTDLPEDRCFEGLAAYALRQAHIGKDDVIFLSSVSGQTASVVDLAYEAEKIGVKVIAFTSMKYASQLPPVHSSGKKLYEIATLTIDNCAPAAEAMLEVDWLDSAFAAASGIATDYILWSLTSVAVEELVKTHGIKPAILRSANYPGGAAYNESFAFPQYMEKGY